MKYKVGDKVVIKKDLKVGDEFKFFSFNPAMETARENNEYLTICCVGDIGYLMKEDLTAKHVWTEEMIEGLYEEPEEEEMKKLVVMLNINYIHAQFDFDDMKSAAEFMDMVLDHYSESNKDELEISMKKVEQ